MTGNADVISANALSISVITPTIGRPISLARLLASLVRQTHPVDEVVIADGSSDNGTVDVCADARWAVGGLSVKRISVLPPHAVRQRNAAIDVSRGDLLLLLDDDVELERDCVEQLLRVLERHPEAVAVMADLNNQNWPMPTSAWRLYLRLVHGMKEGEWQGRVLGPLLRYGFNPLPEGPTPIDWLGTGNSLVRRQAFERAGGFSDFFLHRSTMNEDVDLGLRLAKQGTILFCPQARLGHFHDPGGRVTLREAAEEDLVNRYFILRRTVGKSRLRSLCLVLILALVETVITFVVGLRRRCFNNAIQAFLGRVSAIWRISRNFVKLAKRHPKLNG